MIPILEEKQVGDVSYFVATLPVLESILTDEKILHSTKQELNPNTGKKQYYISTSRSMTDAAKRNNKRWRFGIVVDGTKLSNRYSIQPYSYAGTNLDYSDLRVKYINAYDNGTYTLNLVNLPTFEISKKVYDMIVKEIENMPEDLKNKKNLQHNIGGKKTVGGRKRTEQYLFNVKTGGLKLTYKKFPELSNIITKHTAMNETEERIWIPDNKNFIDIKSCIKAVILPKKLTEDEQEYIDIIYDLLNSKSITNIIEY